MRVSVKQEPGALITVELAGRLESRAWQAALKEVSKLLTSGQRAPILLLAEGFEGWEPGGWDDLSFQRDHDAHIARIAIVADLKWKDRVLMFTGQGLRDVDIRFFEPVEQGEARRWLNAAAP